MVHEEQIIFPARPQKQGNYYKIGLHKIFINSQKTIGIR